VPPNAVSTAMMMCSFGVAPATLNALNPTVLIGGMPAATIMDSKPMVNIPTFGMCTTPTNPVVASATAAALGVLTPMPCIPATSAPWVPGAPTALIAGNPALTAGSTCLCNWGGVIQMSFPGQVTTLTG
jgi:uncharacterized Zn-binding protein involved in type VI secretion